MTKITSVDQPVQIKLATIVIMFKKIQSEKTLKNEFAII